jgi:methionine salvage enolase-phosphatase E1
MKDHQNSIWITGYKEDGLLEDLINAGIKPEHTQPIHGRQQNKKKKMLVLILSFGSLPEQGCQFF